MTKGEAVKAIGTVVEYVEAGLRGVCLAAEDWEDPATQRVAFLVFVRPVGGGRWHGVDGSALEGSPGGEQRMSTDRGRRALLVRRLTAYVCRVAGPVLIIAISGSCGFVFGATLAHP